MFALAQLRSWLRWLCVFALAPASGVSPAATSPWLADATDGQPRIRLHFFWTATCPHCQAAHPFVADLPKRVPWVELESRQLGVHPDNLRLFRHLARELGQDAGVPAFAFCGEMMVGWESAETTGKALEAALEACRQRVASGGDVVAVPQGGSSRIRVPGIGTVDAASLSLPVMTLLLAGLDAFNPCAFFVLLFLLSMMAHQRNPGRMLAIGGVFVAISGLMYFAFMVAWLNIFQLLGQLAWVTAAAGIVALVIGLVNVKDFFAFGQGVSLSISEPGKQDIFRRARDILGADRLGAMLAATTLLAIAANFYELLCTAGLPMVYTRLLTLQEPSVTARYLYLALYNLIYVLPLAAIVAVFARTLGARKLDEHQGRLLKLLSGLMMLGLGGLLLVAPQRTADIRITLALILAALAITWLAARGTKR